jgi:hypothetical protein
LRGEAGGVLMLEVGERLEEGVWTCDGREGEFEPARNSIVNLKGDEWRRGQT